MKIDTATERLRLWEDQIAGLKRLAELRADAVGLALRFAHHGGPDAGGAELVLALKECLQACEVLILDITAVRQRFRRWRGQDAVPGWDEVAWVRKEHVRCLMSLREKLLRQAADTHRKANVARRTSNARSARRLFGIKNRCEAVAAALGHLAAHSDGSEG